MNNDWKEARSDAASSTPMQRPALGMVQLFTFSFGTIVGVGWLTLVGGWINAAGPVGAAWAFALGAVGFVLVGLCYAELGTRYPQSGGEMVYARQLYGQTAGFYVGWLVAFTAIGVVAFEAISLGWIIGYLVPWVRGPLVYEVLGQPVRLGDLGLAIIGMTVVTALNVLSVKASARFQDILTFSKIAISLGFAALAVTFGDPRNLEPLLTNHPAEKWSGFFAVMAVTPFFYSGFNVVPQVLGEAARTKIMRHLGLVMSLSILAAGVFYVLVIVATAISMPRELLVMAELPAAAAFGYVMGSEKVASILLVAAVFGLLTTWNAVLFSGARVLSAMASQGYLPASWASTQHPSSPPARAVLIIALAAFTLVLFGRGIVVPVVSATGTVYATLFAMVCASCIVVRTRDRAAGSDNYRMPGGRLTASAAATVSVAMIMLAIREAFSADSPVPPELIMLGMWLLLGSILWTRVSRCEVQ